MRKIMKYTYGPLIWNCTTEDDNSGNYWWPGNPPCGYDDTGIPIDEKGFQCLPIDSLIHPDYKPKETSFHPTLATTLPTIASARAWFDEGFFDVTDYQVARFIIRWYDMQHKSPSLDYNWKLAKNTYRTRERLVMHLWPELVK
jgi:hypothetical protein